MKLPRPLAIAVITLVLLHQLVAGVFAGGTVLCISRSGDVALQPAGMTCCSVHRAGAAEDACCADDACEPTTPNGAVVVGADDCSGCTDHTMLSLPTLPPHADMVAHPVSVPLLIAVLPWRNNVPTRTVMTTTKAPDRAPPPLRFLNTVILRC